MGSQNEIYLDWNSTWPLRPDVVQALASAASELWANPASVHAAGRRARAAVEDTRELLAAVLGFHPRDVVFTSGGTEANNLALAAASALITSRLEHPSVTAQAERLASAGVPVVWANVGPDGIVELQSIERALDELTSNPALPEPPVVSVMAVNHETGVLQPIEAIAHCARRYRARLHVDAVQLVGKAQLTVLEHADSVAVAAHKIGGPKGIGALAFRGSPPRPLLLGGSQERGIRPGTQDALAALGFGVALRALAALQLPSVDVAGLRDRLESSLARVGEVNGGTAPRLPHVSNVSFTGESGPELVAALDLHGVRVSSGSACSAGTPEPSAVITAMLGAERARSAVRFSLGPTTTNDDIARTLGALSRVLGKAL